MLQQQQTDNDIIRIVVISDTHLLHSKLELPQTGVDILIHCGDFACKGSLSGVHDFWCWFSAQTQFKDRIIVDGNHDQNRIHQGPMNLLLEVAASTTTDGNASKNNDVTGLVQFLQDETIVCANGRLRVHGFSWDTCQNDQFTLDVKATGGDNQGDDYPVDIFVAHMPACLDRHPGATIDELPGSHNLAMLALEKRVPLTLGGHFHWDRGAVGYYWESNNPIDQGHPKIASWLINAASTHHGDTVYPPIVIDFNLKTRTVENIEGLETTITIKLEESFLDEAQSTTKPKLQG